MIGLVVVLLIAIFALAVAVYLLEFRLGGGHWKGELIRVRTEAAEAERALHEVTRTAFVAMSEEAQRRAGWHDPSPPCR